MTFEEKNMFVDDKEKLNKNELEWIKEINPDIYEMIMRARRERGE